MVFGADTEETKAWLENISTAANTLDTNDVQGWKDLLSEIRTGLPGIENTDFGKNFFYHRSIFFTKGLSS